MFLVLSTETNLPELIKHNWIKFHSSAIWLAPLSTMEGVFNRNPWSTGRKRDAVRGRLFSVGKEKMEV